MFTTKAFGQKYGMLLKQCEDKLVGTDSCWLCSVHWWLRAFLMEPAAHKAASRQMELGWHVLWLLPRWSIEKKYCCALAWLDMSYKWVTRDQRSDATEDCIDLEDFFWVLVLSSGSMVLLISANVGEKTKSTCMYRHTLQYLTTQK